MSFNESVSLSENFTYDTGLVAARLARGLGTGLVGVGMLILLGEWDLANYTLFF